MDKLNLKNIPSYNKLKSMLENKNLTMEEKCVIIDLTIKAEQDVLRLHKLLMNSKLRKLAKKSLELKNVKKEKQYSTKHNVEIDFNELDIIEEMYRIVRSSGMNESQTKKELIKYLK